MAGTMTHFEFMKELSSRIDFQGDKNLFLVAGQGHDLLYFIKLKEIKLFATRGLLAKEIASNKFREVVIAWQKEIIVTQNKDLEILLYGYIAHHILDSYIHPWLNNTCDCYFDKFDKKTWQNNGKHEMLESGLDMLINSPYKFKIPRVKIPVKTINSLNSIFKSVYNIKNIGFLLAKGINNMPSFISLYRKDRLGIKKLGYKAIDMLKGPDKQKYEFLAYNYSRDFINNISNNYWQDFYKLYNDALDESQKLILKIQKNLNIKKVVDKIPVISAT